MKSTDEEKVKRISIDLPVDLIESVDDLKKQWGLRRRGLVIERLLEVVLTKDNEQDVARPRYVLLAEAAVQIGLIGVTTYIFREVIHKGLRAVFGKNLHGNPSKYAILIVAPTMFSQQKSLIKKITHVWN